MHKMLGNYCPNTGIELSQQTCFHVPSKQPRTKQYAPGNRPLAEHWDLPIKYLVIKIQKTAMQYSWTSEKRLPPEVPESTVSPYLLQPLKILSQLVVQTISKDL